jgi:poly-gamma-glutamate capsule biosynthesis protein CapA/YwtB (metallophosphatase superfamily)
MARRRGRGLAAPMAASAPAESGHTEQPQGPQRILTRREFVVTAVATAAVAGCAPFAASSAATRKPHAFALTRPATVTYDATIPAELASVVASALAGHGGVSVAEAIASTVPPPDFLLTFGAAPKGYSTSAIIGASAWALATHLRVPVDEVTHAQAQGLLSGAIGDWSAVGAPASLRARVFWLAGMPTPSGVTLPASATKLPTVNALLDALRATPGAVAALPAEAFDWTVHHVGVDGVFAAQGRGDVSKGGLGALPLRLCVADALAKQGCDPAKVGAATPKALTNAAQTLDLVAVGDIMLGRGVLNQMLARNDFNFPYRAIHDELAQGDLRVGNLECMVTDLVAPPSDNATFTFICPSKGIAGLTYAGFDIVTLANNHANGEGQTVFADQRRLLQQSGILHCGGGDSLAEATAPAIKAAKGTRVAILSYDNIMPQGPFAGPTSWGLAPIDLVTLPGDLVTARQQADLVIPYFHWGIEYTKDPTTYQQSVAHAAIDAGADMVLGNHPHWTQAIEQYKGKLIIYSMGNFVFDQDWSEETMEGMLLHLYWRAGKLVSVRFRPTKDHNRCQPAVMSPTEAVGDFARMWSGTDMLAAGLHGAG